MDCYYHPEELVSGLAPIPAPRRQLEMYGLPNALMQLARGQTNIVSPNGTNIGRVHTDRLVDANNVITWFEHWVFFDPGPFEAANTILTLSHLPNSPGA